MEKLKDISKKINLIMSEIDGVYHQLNVILGLSDGESSVLYALDQKADCSQHDIVRLTGLSKQTVNSAVKKMIGNGLLEPLCGARNEKLILTAAGKKVMQEKTAVIVQIENNIYSQWTKQEQKLFIQMNEEFLTRLKAQVKNLQEKNDEKEND